MTGITRRSGLLPGLLLALLAGCVPVPPPPSPPTAPSPPERLTLSAVSWAELPGWSQEQAAFVLPAFARSCARLTRLPFDTIIGADGSGGTAADWFGPCGAAARVPAEDQAAARAFFEAWFIPHAASAGGKAEGMFTGYYEPEMKASLTQTPPYIVPLLARPKDLVTVDLPSFGTNLPREQLVGRVENGRLLPYPTRAEIEAGELGDAARPLAWVEDAVDAHILHIQGSGRLILDDGRSLRLGVAATNGRPFIGIGKVMKEKGLLGSDSSMPAIRAWLKANRFAAGPLMAANPRYVFYRPVEGEGPIGAEGVVLTPERSLAVDTRFVPLGVPVFLDTLDPAGQPLRRLMIAQDTGAAIKGPVRGDFFWGSGEAAFEKAGRMKSPGRTWLLLPRERSPKVAQAR